MRRPASADFFADDHDLTTASTRAHDRAATEKNVVGFDSPSGAAMSRTAFALRLFCRLGAPSFGRPGGGSRKARRCSTGLSTSVSVALPFDSGMAVQNRNWSTAMTKSQGATAPTQRLTRFTPFQPVDAGRAHLFAVNADIDAGDALDQATCFLSCAVEVLRDLACDLAEEQRNDHRAWSALYLTEISYAVAVAAAGAIHKEGRP